MKHDSPSATAYLIARSTVFLSRDPDVGCFVPVRSAELSSRFIQGRRWLSRWLDRITNLRPLASVLERATIPGIKLHYALRKRFLEETAEAAIKEGVRQVVVLGAGFDTLALRLHESFPELNFFELDHPLTQQAKKRVVERDGSSSGNLHFVALDLTSSTLEERLLSHAGYDPNAKTLFIAEGLLMYLARHEVDRVFQFIRQSPGSRFAFTFMTLQRDGRIGFGNSSCAVDAWLRIRGERFKWGIETSELNKFLAAKGFKALSVANSDSLRARYLAPKRLHGRELAEGECICVSECS